jgi:ABC-type transport system involved in multi-copper enzyme maturation permease subunit
MKLWTLIMTTFRELAAKAALISLAGISSFILIFIALALGVETRADGIVLQMFGQDVQPAVSLDSLLPTVRALQAGLVRGLFTGIILFGIFATAGCIPGMMEKGTIDIYLSKPLSRGVLLLGKALGAVTVIFLNILYFVGGLWLIFGIKTGVWNPGFLISISTLTYTFIVLYSMVVLFGILFRSTAFRSSPPSSIFLLPNLSLPTENITFTSFRRTDCIEE